MWGPVGYLTVVVTVVVVSAASCAQTGKAVSARKLVVRIRDFIIDILPQLSL